MARITIENVPDKIKREYHSEIVGIGRTMREDLIDYMDAYGSGDSEKVLPVVDQLLKTAGIASYATGDYAKKAKGRKV